MDHFQVKRMNLPPATENSSQNIDDLHHHVYSEDIVLVSVFVKECHDDNKFKMPLIDPI